MPRPDETGLVLSLELDMTTFRVVAYKLSLCYLVVDGRRRSELGSGHELRAMDSISQPPGRSIGSDGQVVLRTSA